MGEPEEKARQERSPVSALNIALTWAFSAVLLLIVGLALDVGWTAYLVVAVWAGVALVWWVRYRRSRVEQRD